MRIHLLHTNDVHSQLENHMRVGACLRKLRASLQSQGEHVLTFDIGDAMDRVRPETEATQGEINAALLAALRYDGWIFGNNEGLTISPSSWPNLVETADTAVFGTNLRQPDGQPFPYFTESKVFTLSGIRVGVFGITPNYDLPYSALGIQATDPILAAMHAEASMRVQGCDVVVVLSHLGLGADRKLALKVPGLDVVLGGHTHHFMDQAEFVGRTAVFQAGKHGISFGHTVIEMDLTKRRVTGVNCSRIDINPHGPLDSDMFRAYQSYLPRVEDNLAVPVLTLTRPLNTRYDAESAFPNLLADALYAKYPCDLALVNAGLLTASFRAGQIRYGHLLGACATPTRPVHLTLSGSALFNVVEQGIKRECALQKGFGYGFRGSVVGMLALAGAQALCNQTREGLQLKTLYVGHQPIDFHRDYRILTCEYLWLAPVFQALRQGRDIKFHRPLVREVLAAYLEQPGCVEQAQVLRYTVE